MKLIYKLPWVKATLPQNIKVAMATLLKLYSRDSYGHGLPSPKVCPLCKALASMNCKNCPWIIFEGIKCVDWLEKTGARNFSTVREKRMEMIKKWVAKTR
jgi:hypothetical protein